MYRGLFSQNTNPIAEAPAAAAASASSGRVMPQIFTSIGATSSADQTQRTQRTRRKEQSWFGLSVLHVPCTLCVLCVLCVDAALEQAGERGPGISRRHQTLPDQDR